MKPYGIFIAVAMIGMSLALAAQESSKPADGKAKATAAPAPSPRAADEKALAAVLEAFTKAFNAGDAKAAAATYAENALVVTEDNERVDGRAAIQARLQESFTENPGSVIVIEADELRFLGPDTAIEDGWATITPAKTLMRSPERSRYVAVYVKNNGQWLQSVVRDQAVEALTPHERLKELEWLVGEWVNESEDAVVHTTCKWSDNGNFLLREFTMKTQGRPVLAGSQRIGWDPTRKQFKMWVFDSEGGFGEGYWTQNGDQWVIKAEGVRQDGQHASATNIITRLGKERASWQSLDRTIGGIAVPGADEFIIVRKPPEVGK